MFRTSPDRLLESLYERYARDIYRYTLALLDRPADAEDATQATFLNAYRALERGERPREAGSWLRTIALNVSREHYRRASRRPDEVSLDEDPGELVVDEPTPAIADVIRGLSHLPFNQRAALVMREFEGRSLSEIAKALETSNGAVESLLFRGRRALREQLEGSLRCDEAEQAISRQLDGALPREERAQLRAHVRECPECASLARRMRAQQASIKSLAVVPVPASLLAFSKLTAGSTAGGAAPAAAPVGGSLLAAAGTPAAVKLAAVAVAAAVAAGVGGAALLHHDGRGAPSSAAVAVHTAKGPARSPHGTASTSTIVHARRQPVVSHVSHRSAGTGAAHSARSAHASQATSTQRVSKASHHGLGTVNGQGRTLITGSGSAGNGRANGVARGRAGSRSQSGKSNRGNSTTIKVKKPQPVPQGLAKGSTSKQGVGSAKHG